MGAENKSIIQEVGQNVTNQQNNWDRTLFDDGLFSHGYKSYIERAVKCPCIQKSLGTPLSDCQNCGGTGWFFIDKVDTVLQCTSINNRNKHEPWSMENTGTISISSRAQDKLGYMDKVTLYELESWHSQVVKTTLNIDETEAFAFLLYDPVTVYDVYKYNSSDAPLLRLKEGVDYTIEGNKIIISSPNKPYTEESLSIRYTHRPVYHIIDINRDLIKQLNRKDCFTEDQRERANFPLNCVGRRAHYVLEAPDYSGSRLFDNTDYTILPKKYDY